MNLIRFALRKPISIMVFVAGMLFFGINAMTSIKVDILPQMNLPVIYIAHPFGGYTPNQMEAYFAKTYVNVLLFANGIKSIDTKNSQGFMLMKVTYYEGTNMAQAAAELSALSNRAQASFPPGSQPPFIIRFDASSLPVGQLILSSKTRSNDELQDLANTYVRPSFTAVPGLLAPAPFGGSPRTIDVNVDPAAMRAHNLSAQQIVDAINVNNQTAPSGNVRIGDMNYLTPTNYTIDAVKDFENIPLFKGGVQNVYMRDVAKVKDGADLTAGYALINGKRSVYVSIAKSGDASTWDVVKGLKANLPVIQNTLPEDVTLTYEFDQSVYVINAVKSLIKEGTIGAVLTGLMVLLFLGDRRAALIVILTIPTCIISAVFFLKLAGQTINIMSLSGLALAIGILVDESTVTIENIHQHFDMGKPKALAIWDACKEIAFPKLLILLCILAVFAPAFTMVGIPGALFLPLALAIGFSMIVSFLLSQTFVPILANWMMKPHVHEHVKTDPTITDEEDQFNQTGLSLASEKDTLSQKKILVQANHEKPNGKIGLFDRFKNGFLSMIDGLFVYTKTVVMLYLVLVLMLAAFFVMTIGRDVLPKVNGSQFQLRTRLPDGTRLERTEEKVDITLKEIKKIVGPEHVNISSVYVGQHPSAYSVNPIYLFMGGPHEAVFQVAFKDYEGNMDEFKEELRAHMKKLVPEMKLSFEPIELTEKVLSQGSTTPVEVRFIGKNKKVDEAFANKVIAQLKKVDYMRDIQFGQPNHYPALDINIDRVRAAQLGVGLDQITRSLVASTSSSRFTDKNTWIDTKIGLSYNVQVQIPFNQMRSKTDLGEISLLSNNTRPTLSDVATIKQDTTYGEADDMGATPYLSVTANLNNKDLGSANKDVARILSTLGKLPRGLVIKQVGMGPVLTDTLSSLQSGLIVAILVIFLMLSANFQSFRIPVVVLATVPAVILGSLIMLTLCGSTLNLQSYMGIIMSVGVSVSNAVMLITNAEEIRQTNGGNARSAAREAAGLRLRPIVMTSVSMVVGMMPMAIGEGEGGDAISPLGRAVIGGLVFSTFAVLIILPLVFTWVQGNVPLVSPSLDPEDEESTHFIKGLSEG